jgi:hypothetical protein
MARTRTSPIVVAVAFIFTVDPLSGIPPSKIRRQGAGVSRECPGGVIFS